MNWNVIDTHVNSAADNMKFDANLLENISSPLIHYYEWKNICATYGHFIKPEEYFQPAFEAAKRPTGGGIIFHTNDFSFSIVVPASHPLYRKPTLEKYHSINRSVASALHHLFGKTPQLLDSTPASQDAFLDRFCMAHPTKYDLMFNNRKIGGAAQRKTKNGFLHQCSIKLCPDDLSVVKEAIKTSDPLLKAIEQGSTSLIPEPLPEAEQKEIRKELKKYILIEFNRRNDHDDLRQ